MPTKFYAKYHVTIICVFFISFCVFGCANKLKTEFHVKSVAIWAPEPLGLQSVIQADFAELMASEVIEKFKYSSRYDVVEREKFMKILEEQQLGNSNLADERFRLRLGRMIGTQLMVFGVFQVLGNTMRFDLRMVDVASGRIVSTGTAIAPAHNLGLWLEAANQAAESLLSY